MSLVYFYDAVPGLQEGETCFVQAGGVFQIVAVMTKAHAERQRYQVQCLTCKVFMHAATPCPEDYIKPHARDAHAFTGPLEWFYRHNE